jgi:hypothetical protein
MTELDLAKLALLTAEQQAALSDEQKAVFAILDEKDQKFFAGTFTPKDLPKALDRKAEILKHNRASRDRLDKLKTVLAEVAQAPTSQPAGGGNTDDIIGSVAAAVGLGAAAAVVATDNTAFWAGLNPADLKAPLQVEFGDKELTDVEFAGSPNALEATVFLVTGRRFVPALIINMVRRSDGVEVKMGDLTSQGMLETIKGGGEKLFQLAMKGVSLWTRKGRGVAPTDLVGMANSAFNDTTSLAQIAGNLRLKERAWSAIRTTADGIEKAYRDRQAKEQAARMALEREWDAYYNCPTCAVSFQEGDEKCRVCGTDRPDQPARPDPRLVT